MVKTPSTPYIDAKFDQLKAAVRERNGAAGVSVIEQIETDGYPELAAEIAQRLTEAGIARLQ